MNKKQRKGRINEKCTSETPSISISLYADPPISKIIPWNEKGELAMKNNFSFDCLMTEIYLTLKLS